MIKGLFFCAIACGVASPGAARDGDSVNDAANAIMRSAATVRNDAILLPRIIPIITSDAWLARGSMLGLRSLPVQVRDLPAPNRRFAEIRPRASLAVPVEIVTLNSRYAIEELETMKSWRIAATGPVTNSANGLYAVRDTLGESRKPRAYRPTVISTMLVLRIDGKDDSPPFSIGGGGVAAALWRAMPR